MDTTNGVIGHHNGSRGQKWFPETMSGGAAFADVDSDGDLDILLVEGGRLEDQVTDSQGDIVLLTNDGTGSFSRQTAPGLENLPGYGMGIYPADLDNDGDQDLVYTTLGQNSILMNEGGTFVPSQIALPDKRSDEWSTAALIFDSDRDGLLDILIGNYVDWTVEKDLFCTTNGAEKGYCTPELYEGVQGVFYHNLGGGRFEDQTVQSGFDALKGKTLGMAMTDVNKDGLIDILVANDTDPDQLFINIGGRFEERGISSGLAFDERGRARAGMGIDAGITDDSDQISLFVGNFSDEMIGVYRQIGPTSFLDRAAASGIGHASMLTLTFGIVVADFNLDGQQDVFAANGHVEQTIEAIRDNVRFRQYPHMFLSDGTGKFDDVRTNIPALSPMAARAVAIGDIDQDGDPDLIVAENNGPIHIYRTMSQNKGLRVGLRGVNSNAQGIGTRVELWQQGRRQQRLIKTGSSYLSGSDVAAYFGLGDSSVADSLVLHWPSGAVQVIDSIDSATITVTEPSGS